MIWAVSPSGWITLVADEKVTRLAELFSDTIYFEAELTVD